MDAGKLEHIRSWFAGYCQSFYSGEPEDQRHIILKEQHTYRVCANIVRIGADEGLEGERLLLAEAIALLHDVGRFEQYRRYRTFRDGISVNHATLGAEILRGSDLLADLSPPERELINHAVVHHNAFALPMDSVGDRRCFLQLVRDADKLDIWRVFEEYYAQPEGERSAVVGLHLPDGPDCSEEVLEQLNQGGLVRLSTVRSLNDFKLVQLSWVYDLTFRESFQILAERGHVDGIAATLPELPEVRGVVEAIQGFIEGKIVSGPVGTFRMKAGTNST